MKIVIAPDSFKESLSASAAAKEIATGFREVLPEAEYCLLPMADGGEGTTTAMVAATKGALFEVDVTDPLGNRVKACYGLTGDRKTAIIEMAAASGLCLVAPCHRDPMKTTSFGTGELIAAALDAGAHHLIIGLGGSATNDGGAGMLQALGVKLLGRDGHALGVGGGNLVHLDRIDVGGMDPRLKTCRIEAACDVNNPLIGPQGASYIFGPQKGASAKMAATLDNNLAHFAELIRRDIGVQVDALPGAGAAGGMGAALWAFLGTTLRPGIEIVIEAVGLHDAVKDADLVITGEGRIDSQSIHGKTPVGVAAVAKRYGIPVIGIAGSLSSDVGVVHEYGIDAVFSILNQVGTLEEALPHAAANLRAVSRNIAATLKIGRSS